MGAKKKHMKSNTIGMCSNWTLSTSTLSITTKNDDHIHKREDRKIKKIEQQFDKDATSSRLCIISLYILVLRIYFIR